jgi:hypothetical protein
MNISDFDETVLLIRKILRRGLITNLRRGLRGSLFISVKILAIHGKC